jgi:8-amino-7-oxononanoate synthase
MFDLVLSDRRSHNSVIHGLRAGNATVEVLDLNSSDEVVRVVEGRRDARIALIAPSLEGITGEAVRLSLAPVRDSVFVIRDECHSFGAIGETGFQEFDELMPEVRIVGFSKAFGTMGAAVCGSQEFLEALAQVASPWIFSTAVPPIIWRVNGSLIDVVASLTDERRTICELARRFRANATAGGLAHHGDLHITGLDIPPSLDANTVEAEFRRAGFFLKVSQYPSRPKESPCARVVFSPVHEGKDGDRLAEVATDLLTHRL